MQRRRKPSRISELDIPRRDQLLAKIEGVAGDIAFVESQTGAPASSRRPGPRNPRTIKALENKLEMLQIELHNKHTAWLRQRGESGVAPPLDGPRWRKKGKGARLIDVTDWVKRLKTKDGKAISERSAIGIATAIQLELLKLDDIDREKKGLPPNPKSAKQLEDDADRKGLPTHHRERRYYEAIRRRKALKK